MLGKIIKKLEKNSLLRELEDLNRMLMEVGIGLDTNINFLGESKDIAENKRKRAMMVRIRSRIERVEEKLDGFLDSKIAPKDIRKLWDEASLLEEEVKVEMIMSGEDSASFKKAISRYKDCCRIFWVRVKEEEKKSPGWAKRCGLNLHDTGVDIST